MAWTVPKVDWVSPDIFDYASMNKVGANLVYLKAHVDETTGMHGAVSAATAEKLVIRDVAGRAKVAAPSAAGDIAILSTVTGHTTDEENPHATTKAHVGLGNVDDVKQMPIGGDTFTGQAVAHSPDTDYTAALIRNIKLLTAVPSVGDLENGEIALVYEV